MDYRFLVRSAANVAVAVAKVHEAGAVVGDINHSGILVSDKATAALIDADSFQFGERHLCRVGVPEYILLEQNMTNEVQTPTRLIRLPEVKLRTGLARSSIYRMMEDGCFPRPRKLGPRAVAWMVSDIDHWIDSRPSKQVR